MKEELTRESTGLLVVEDDPQVADSLVRGLSEAGFAVKAVGRLSQAGEQLAHGAPALVVLDLNLPDGDGRTWLRRVRREGHRMPVIILTARDTLPERVAGSDLVPAFFDHVAACHDLSTAEEKLPLRVFLLGAAPGVAEQAQRNIHQRWPGVEVVGTLAPPIGFEKSEEANREIFDAVAHAKADLLIVGLGAPKQELWTSRHADQLQAKVALCVGATIDFLAGNKDRSPRWMRKVGLEWLHRLAREPGRLVRRYGRDAWIFPQLVWRDWKEGHARHG